MKNNPLIKNSAEFVFNFFKENLSADHVYHSYKHTLTTVKACKELSKSYNLSSRAQEKLLLAAWFHDTGYTKTYKGHEEESVKILKEFLKGEYGDDDTKEIEALILSTKMLSVPDGTLQEILHDADYINNGKKSFDKRASLLRIEWERLLDVKYTDVEWAQLQLDFLVSTPFKTEEAVLNYNKQREENIRYQREEIERLAIQAQKLESKLNGDKKPKKEGRGIETLYRSVYAYHINLSSIADNKANIMISINTIIISLVITLFGSGYTFAQDDGFASVRFVFPMAFLLLTSMLAAIFAILSARPNVTSKEKYELSKKSSSILFFGNFSQLQINDFVAQIKLLKDNKIELYDNMSVDIYYLGAVLVKKYKLLTWSYNIFMSGLVLCGLAFIVIMFISY